MIERRVEVDGHGGRVTLAVAEAGRGGRPLLLVHGFTGAKEDFTEWLDLLAERGWHVIAPDLRGHGRSAQPAGEAAYSLDAFATDVVGLLDALGWERAAVLGHSMGGMVVQTAVLRAAERFSCLVLMDTSHATLAVDPTIVELGVAVARTEGMAALLAAQNAAAEASPLNTGAHERTLESRPGYREYGERNLLAVSPDMYAAMLQALTDDGGDPDRLGLLEQLDMPTLVIVGDEDEMFVKPSRRMAEAIRGAELAVIPAAGHSPQFEQPDAWWAALSGFLDRV